MGLKSDYLFKSFFELNNLINDNPLEIYEITKSVLSSLKKAKETDFSVSFVNESASLEFAKQSVENINRETHKEQLLNGIPLAHKALFDRQGWPRDGCCKAYEGRVASKSSKIIERLDWLGAVDCGRLVSVELALGITGKNNFSGTPINPWMADHICGGSSSGSASVVASGLIPASMGTDTGGSVRLPSAACGLVGLKPTTGLLSTDGIFPLSPTLDTPGFLTRSVVDSAVMFFSVACNLDKTSVLSILSYIEKGIAGIQVGVPLNYFFEDIEAEVLAEITKIIELTEDLGASLIDINCPNISSSNDKTLSIIGYESFRLHRMILENCPEKLSSSIRERLVFGSSVLKTDYTELLVDRKEISEEWLNTVFRYVDIVLTPVWPFCTPKIPKNPFKLDKKEQRISKYGARNTRPINFLGFPAIVLPIGLDKNGLPFSIQLVAPPYGEVLLLRTARALERDLDFCTRFFKRN